MIKKANFKRIVYVTLILLICFPIFSPFGCGGKSPQASNLIPVSNNSFNEDIWRDPPLEYHPYVRWWWPGGAVDKKGIQREMDLFQEAGFGGVELQAYLLGLTPIEINSDANVSTVGTSGFFEKVRIAAEEASKRNMSFDFTLESGWPSGGPFVSSAPERQLLMSELDVSGSALYEGPLPPLEPPDYYEPVNGIMGVLGPFDTDAELIAVTAARVVTNASGSVTLDSCIDITNKSHEGNLRWKVPSGTWKIFAFYQNRTGHHPVGAAYPGPANFSQVADHLDPAGAQEVIDGFADPLLSALGSYAPDAIFLDSFEMVGELPWTPSFLQRFQQIKGYDLTPYLPLLFQYLGESKYTQILQDMFGEEPEPVYYSADIGIRVREDYEEVRSELFMEGFIEPIRDWAHANNMSFRMQAHGGWANYLDAYELADIPESEGLFAGGAYDFLKLASSAGHTAGRTFISSESFVSLNPDPRALTLEDFYLLAGRAYSAGINRIIYLGYPYLYILENGKRLYGYPAHEESEKDMITAGGVAFTSWLDEDHPVWPDLPEFNMYLSRLCYVLSLGTHRADVAWLNCDWRFPDKTIGSLMGFLPEQGESDISLALKRAGLVYDRVSPSGLTNASAANSSFAVGSARYDCLLLTNFSVASPELMASIERLADAGIPVLVMGGLPERAPGFADYEQRDAATQSIAESLRSKTIAVEGVDELGSALHTAGLQPPLTASDDGTMAFALDHREIVNGDILFLFNEAQEKRTQALDVNLPVKRVRVFDPETGKLSLDATPDISGHLSVEVTIPARRSLVLIIER